MSDRFDEQQDLPGRLGAHLARPEPPPDLEHRVTRTLADRGLISGAHGLSRLNQRHIYAIAAGLSMFIAGVVLGRGSSGVPPANDSTSRYAFLFYGSDRLESTGDDVTAHRDWARGLARSGHAVSGEKLEAGAVLIGNFVPAVGPTDSGLGELRGFFIVSAGSESEALAIARTSPHFVHGGWVVIQRVADTRAVATSRPTSTDLDTSNGVSE